MEPRRFDLKRRNTWDTMTSVVNLGDFRGKSDPKTVKSPYGAENTWIFPELKNSELEFWENRAIFPELEFWVFEFPVVSGTKSEIKNQVSLR